MERRDENCTREGWEDYGGDDDELKNADYGVGTKNLDANGLPAKMHKRCLLDSKLGSRRVHTYGRIQ